MRIAKREYPCGCLVSRPLADANGVCIRRGGIDYCQDHSAQQFGDTVNRFHYPEVNQPADLRRIQKNYYPTVRGQDLILRKPARLIAYPLAAQGYGGFEGFFLVDIFDDIFNWIMETIRRIIDAVIWAVKHPFEALKDLFLFAITLPFNFTVELMDFLKDFPLTRWLYNGVDGLTGGLLTSIRTAFSLPYRFVTGQPISRAELLGTLMLVIQVGLIVLTGGSAISIIAFAASALKKGPLGKTALGRTLLDLAVIGAGAIVGGASLFEAFEAAGEKYALGKAVASVAKAVGVSAVILGLGVKAGGAAVSAAGDDDEDLTDESDDSEISSDEEEVDLLAMDEPAPPIPDEEIDLLAMDEPAPPIPDEEIDLLAMDEAAPPIPDEEIDLEDETELTPDEQAAADEEAAATEEDEAESEDEEADAEDASSDAADFAQELAVIGLQLAKGAVSAAQAADMKQAAADKAASIKASRPKTVKQKAIAAKVVMAVKTKKAASHPLTQHSLVVKGSALPVTQQKSASVLPLVGVAAVLAKYFLFP